MLSNQKFAFQLKSFTAAYQSVEHATLAEELQLTFKLKLCKNHHLSGTRWFLLCGVMVWGPDNCSLHMTPMGQYPPYWNAWGSWTLLAFGKLVFHPNCSLLRYGTMRLWEVVHIKRCGLTFEEIDTKVTLFFNKLFWSLTSFWQDNIAEEHNSHFLFSSFISLLYCLQLIITSSIKM